MAQVASGWSRVDSGSILDKLGVDSGKTSGPSWIRVLLFLFDFWVDLLLQDRSWVDPPARSCFDQGSQGQYSIAFGSIQGRFGVDAGSVRGRSTVDSTPQGQFSIAFVSIQGRFGIDPVSIRGPSSVDSMPIQGHSRVDPGGGESGSIQGRSRIGHGYLPGIAPEHTSLTVG